MSTKTLIIEQEPNILDSILMTDRNIEKTVSFFDFTTSDIKDEEVEERISFPIFVEAFYKFLKTRQRLPAPEEFFSYYVGLNGTFFNCRDKFSDRIMEGLKARVMRAYPSYIRDLHFAVLCKSDLKESFPYGFVKSFTVLSNYKLDVEGGIDVLIEVNGQLFGVNLFTKTKRSLEARSKKEHRHTPYSNVTLLECPLELDNCSKHGDIFLYNYSHVISLKKLIYGLIQNS